MPSPKAALARVREKRPFLDHLIRAFDELAPYEARFTVWGFTLFEQGPDHVWRPQRDYPFGGGGLPGPVEPPG